ncbi:hypothetical protein ACTRXD_17520 [Nitrospira sp. T9]|uniref:hypothetical protein n=1 Tax=unclassified Nitrospira TaxID=2652172 RepID=UPI003F97D3DF
MNACFGPKAEILTCVSLPDGCLTKKDKFSEEAKKEAENIIRACVLVLCDHDYHPAEIKDLLTELGRNYGCWLEIIERVLDEGLQKLSNEYDFKFT